MTTMNEQDDETRRGYDRYQLEIARLEYDRDMRRLSEEAYAEARDQALDELHREDEAEVEMLEHDEWLEDAYAAEELERLQRLEEEKRNDH